MENIIVAEGVKRCFKTHGGDFWALNGIDAQVPQGKLTILRGRSGSGKTTLMNILGALDKPTQGKVFLEGKDIAALDENRRARIRRTDIGFVFQSIALIPMMNALENVEFALRMTRYRGNRTQRAMECLKLVGLGQRSGHMPQELSGGEQQRVAIARAIAHRPKVLFADEPTGALDTNTGLSVVKLFQELTQQEGVTIVMTTHDTGLMELGDKVYELEGGELVHGQ
ncbi:MAG: ABC transporter ATP-binding protein [Eubacteriales bacterium]|nr:ABC transporter ATP-binding protein [Eubacteriales bacterium]